MRINNDKLKEGEEQAPSIARNLLIIFAVVFTCAMGGGLWIFYWLSKL